MVDRLITVCMRPAYCRGTTTKLYDAAFKKVGRPLTLVAAERLAKAVKPSDTVILSAGWVVPPLYPVGEPCGTAGTAALARAIYFGLEAKSVFLSEEPVLPVWEACVNALEMRTVPYKHFKETPYAISTRSFPIDEREAKKAAKEILDELEPSAVITAEKCSKNEKGVWHTGVGKNMGPWTAKIDYLIEEARDRGILTIGIGDLGNEIGMGNIHDEAVQILDKYCYTNLGTKCRCGCGGGIVAVTQANSLIVATASNKGCYGLIACLSGLKDDPKVLHTAEQQYRLIDRVVTMGAGDSITCRPSLTEDGAPIKISMHLIDMLHFLVESRKFKEPLFEAARRATGW